MVWDVTPVGLAENLFGQSGLVDTERDFGITIAHEFCNQVIF